MNHNMRTSVDGNWKLQVRLMGVLFSLVNLVYKIFLYIWQFVNWLMNKTTSSAEKSAVSAMEMDRLSALPDSLLIHILSFMDAKEAAKTAVLSKQWRFLWPDSPSLTLEESSDKIEKRRSFMASVHAALRARRGARLDKFHVSFCANKRFASDIGAWVKFGMQNKVKDISLVLLQGEWMDSLVYTLHQTMYSNSSLTRLCLGGCVAPPPRTTVDWRSLTTLTLKDVKLSQEAIEKIASGCPVLESLELGWCRGFSRLALKNPTFRKLEVAYYGDAYIEISAPYMRELDVWTDHNKLRVTNAPLLRKAIVEFDLEDLDYGSDEVMTNMNQFFRGIRYVRQLEVAEDCVKVLSMATNGWQLPQSMVEDLVIHVEDDVRSVCGIIALLESSPELKTFKLYGHVPEDDEEVSITWAPTTKYDLNCDLLHLKTVNIRDFDGSDISGEPTLILAQILLKRATALKKMVIHKTSPPQTSFEMLFRYPKSSQKAVVKIIESSKKKHH